jgi:hypothetical protein
MSNTNTATLNDIDIIGDFIDEEIAKPKKAHTRQTATKRIKIRSGVEVARDDYKRRKQQARKEIKRLRRMIKLQHMHIKQAKATYKIIKLSSK